MYLQHSEHITKIFEMSFFLCKEVPAITALHSVCKLQNGNTISYPSPQTKFAIFADKFKHIQLIKD